MAINFPTSLDALTNPAATDPLNSPSHSGQHSNANDILEALEAKVGIDGSGVATSHDKILSVLKAVDFLVGTATTALSGEIVMGTSPGGELGGTWASPTVDTTHSGSSHAGAAAAETADIRAVDVLVGTATAAFSGEIVVGTAPGGELGGTWASPTVDATHSGSAHADFIAKAFFAAKGDILGASANDMPALTSVGADGTFLKSDSGATSGISWVDHTGAADPHTGYRLESADHTHQTSGLQGGLLSEDALNFTDITTWNASTTKHGFLKKLSNSATDFMDGTGAWDTVKDADLSTSDITTNDASTSKHGFLKKLDNTATHFMDGTGAWSTPASGGTNADVQTFVTGSGNWTKPTAGQTMARIVMIGQGGGGGGGKQNIAGQNAGGGGGGAAGQRLVLYIPLALLAATESYSTVNTGGVGGPGGNAGVNGTAAGTTGTDGSDVTFGGTFGTITAKGGGGGTGGTTSGGSGGAANANYAAGGEWSEGPGPDGAAGGNGSTSGAATDGGSTPDSVLPRIQSASGGGGAGGIDTANTSATTMGRGGFSWGFARGTAGSGLGGAGGPGGSATATHATVGAGGGGGSPGSTAADGGAGGAGGRYGAGGGGGAGTRSQTNGHKGGDGGAGGLGILQITCF